MSDPGLHRLAAFADPMAGAESGNPAGVWIGKTLPSVDTMQRIAADVGFSETAFVASGLGTERTVRYYSPQAEVPFCGHATIAAGVVLGRTSGNGVYRLHTRAGDVSVSVQASEACAEASLISVLPRHEPVDTTLLRDALGLIGWHQDDLDRNIPPARAFAGAWHLVLAAADHSRLATLDYAFEGLRALMLAHDLTTLQLVWREHAELFHARNPFPVGGVVEDPATGAAAVALGGYLRDADLLQAPASLVIRQGQAMGRPSLIKTDIPASGGIRVTGSAVDIS